MPTETETAELASMVSGSQACVLLSIPKGRRDEVGCVVAATNAELEDILLAMLVNLARVLPDYAAEFSIADVPGQVRLGVSVMNRIAQDYLKDPINQ